MIKIGQIGIGHNHSDKMQVLRRYPEYFQLVGYAEENEEWIQRRGNKEWLQGVPRMSVEEVLEKSDAILVETDIWDLIKTAQMCVDAGKHVHIDKPADASLPEFKRLLDTAKEKNLVVQLGYMYRFNPGVMKMLEMVKNGELGNIHAINAEMCITHTDSYRRWLGNFKGGHLYIFGSHLIDLIVYLLGKPNKVLSSVVSSGKNGVEAPDMATAILEYDHTIARVYSNSVEWNGWARRSFSVIGELGTAHIQPMEVPCRMSFAPMDPKRRVGVDTAQQIELPRDPSNAERYDAMLLAFHDYATGKAENPFSYDHEYMVQEVLDQAVGGIEMLSRNLP